MHSETFYRKVYILLLGLTFIVAAAILKVTSSFFIPLTISILLSLVFYPFVKKLNESKIHLPWVVGIILVVLISVVAFVIVGNLLATSIKAVVNAYPKYEDKFMTIYSMLANTFNLPFDENDTFFNNIWNTSKIRKFIQDFAISFSNGVLNSLKNLLLIVLFIIFLLLEMKTVTEKANDAFPNKRTRTKVTEITGHIIAQVTHFISIKFFISLITGILVFISCQIVNLDFAIVWGFLAFILNFIPNFGSITSWAITSIFAVLQFYPHWGAPVFVSAMVLAINMILGNFVEPRWEGHDLGLSPFVILVMLSLWVWMWGFIGAILAVPITVILKIVFENVEVLKPIAILIGNNKRTKTTEKKPEKTEENKQTEE